MLTAGRSKGREENLLGVTRQRNHISLRDSPERKTVGGQDSLCGKYTCSSAEPKRSVLMSLRAFPYLKVQWYWKRAFFLFYW